MRWQDRNVGGDRALRPVTVVFLSVCAIAAFALGGPGSPVSAQSDAPLVEADPYTENEPKALKAAGYTRLGPFLFAGDHTTRAAEKTMGGVPLIWVETEHFKIGSSLEPIPLPTDRVERKRVLAELKRLKKRLPGVKSKPKTLDRWLRLHLFAQRLEDLYSSFEECFGLAPADAAKLAVAAEARGVRDPNMPIGDGAFLGMQGKYAVLLVQKASTLSRYTREYCGASIEDSYRYYFSEGDTFFFGMSLDSLIGDYASDSGLHYGLVFSVVQNMIDGYRGFSHSAPLWWSLGLARHFARAVDKRILLYTAPPDVPQRRDEKDQKWEAKVRRLVGFEVFPTLEEMYTWTTFGELDFTQHMMLWSRVDYILKLGADEARAFFDAMKAPIGWEEDLSRDDVIESQLRSAVQAGLGVEYAELDDAWRKFVKKTYAKR